MQWWAWILIWTFLVLGLIAMLVLLGIRLFRKAITLLEALAEMGEKVAMLGDTVEELRPEEPQNAILTGYPAIVRQREAFRAQRLAIKAERRRAAVLRGRILTQSVPTRRT